MEDCIQPYIGFIIFKPDSYQRGLILPILDFLKQHGVYPVAITKKALDSTLIDRLYVNEMHRYLTHWWVMAEAFSLGPAFPTIVVGKQPKSQHLCAYVRSLVGKTHPLKSMCGQIRYDFRGTHGILNLIHASDDPQSALREAALFFNESQMSDAIKYIPRVINGEQLELPRLDLLISLSELQPDVPLDLRLSAIRHDVSVRIQGRLSTLLPANQTLADLLFGLGMSLIQEKQIIQAHRALQDEYMFLEPIYQARTFLLQQMKAQIYKAGFDDSEAIQHLLNVLAVLVDEDALKVISEQDLLSIPIEMHESIVLHTWWGVNNNQNSRLALESE